MSAIRVMQGTLSRLAGAVAIAAAAAGCADTPFEPQPNQPLETGVSQVVLGWQPRPATLSDFTIGETYQPARGGRRLHGRPDQPHDLLVEQPAVGSRRGPRRPRHHARRRRGRDHRRRGLPVRYLRGARPAGRNTDRLIPHDRARRTAAARSAQRLVRWQPVRLLDRPRGHAGTARRLDLRPNARHGRPSQRRLPLRLRLGGQRTVPDQRRRNRAHLHQRLGPRGARNVRRPRRGRAAAGRDRRPTRRLFPSRRAGWRRRRARTSGLLHYYFGSMEELFVQVLERFTER
jgi:hypothetical protein